MTYYSNPYGRRRTMPGQPGLGGERITIEDYHTLARAYQQLQGQLEQQKQELAAKQRELAEKQQALDIKQDAMARQSADLKQLEAELMWTKAALQQQEKAGAAEASGEELAWRERYLRLQAELETLRRRWEQRYAAETAEARHTILRDMLPLADHLEMALQHGAAVEGETGREFLRSIAATRQAFLDTLKRYGVETVEAHGQPFDPNLHEAVGQVQDAAVPAGAVAQVVQTGYREGERLLRPARVLVSS